MGVVQKSTIDLSKEVNSSIEQIYKRIEKGETDTITLLINRAVKPHALAIGFYGTLLCILRRGF